MKRLGSKLIGLCEGNEKKKKKVKNWPFGQLIGLLQRSLKPPL